MSLAKWVPSHFSPNAFVRAASLCYLCYQPKALDRQWRMWPKLTSVATVILVHQKTPIPRASVAPFPTLFIEQLPT
jgi:hypothetical protein